MSFRARPRTPALSWALLRWTPHPVIVTIVDNHVLGSSCIPIIPLLQVQAAWNLYGPLYHGTQKLRNSHAGTMLGTAILERCLRITITL